MEAFEKEVEESMKECLQWIYDHNQVVFKWKRNQKVMIALRLLLFFKLKIKN